MQQPGREPPQLQGRPTEAVQGRRQGLRPSNQEGNHHSSRGDKLNINLVYQTSEINHGPGIKSQHTFFSSFFSSFFFFFLFVASVSSSNVDSGANHSRVSGVSARKGATTAPGETNQPGREPPQLLERPTEAVQGGGRVSGLPAMKEAITGPGETN